MQQKVYSYIRFSSLEQSKGDSLRRQIELAEEWAKENGFVLDDQLRYRDLGLSGYSGANRTRGELNAFLEQIKRGTVTSGSILLVENLDRLSREQISDALELFMSIIRAGVKIVTLADKMEYDRESINENMMQLMMSLVILSRGHEESLMKSKRVQAAWANKRTTINKKKLTSRCPAWLELSKDKTSFHVFPERAEVIQRIFKMKLDGIGVHTITKTLNKESTWIPTKSSNGWRESYVQKILRMRAVIGEFQPRITNKNRSDEMPRTVPEGEPIPNYFPRIIPDNLFYAVQEQFEQNQHKGGRNGTVSNLFGHIAKCGYCGSPMRYINKGTPPKGGTYLLCDKACLGAGCVKHPIHYSEFESLILIWCQGLDISDVLPDSERVKTESNRLKEHLAGVRGKLSELHDKANNLTNSIASTGDHRIRERLEKALSGFLDEQEVLINKEKELSKSINQLSRHKETTKDHLQEIKSAIHPALGDEARENRIRLRSVLRQLIAKIVIYPAGINRRVFQDMIGTLRPELSKKISDKLEAGDYDNRKKRTYIVKFKTGNWRKIEPEQHEGISAEHNNETGETTFVTWDDDGLPVVNIDHHDILDSNNFINSQLTKPTKQRINKKLNRL